MKYIKTTRSIAILSRILVKEQFKEPMALLWTLGYPSAVFYLMIFSKAEGSAGQVSYAQHTAWYFAYVSCTVAFFSFTLYLVGRRESGFVRSFIYSRYSQRHFLASHFLACSLLSIFYCAGLYLGTRLLFGDYDFEEFIAIFVRYYVCFILFCSMGLLIALLPLNFQNTNTLLSIGSFAMLGIGLVESVRGDTWLKTVDTANPMTYAITIMLTEPDPSRIARVIAIFTSSAVLSALLFRVNPVWGRH